MKERNRWLYAVIGLVIMLLSGFVYAWSVIAKPIGTSRTGWTEAQLSLTFTFVMVFFCIGGLAAGFIGKRITVKIYVIAAGFFFLLGFLITGMTGESIVPLYLGFGVLAGFGTGMVYNAVMSTLSAWFPDKQGLISGIMMMGFGISSFIIGKIYAAVTPTDGSDSWKITFRLMAGIVFIVMMICALIIRRPAEGYVPDMASDKKEEKKSACEAGPGKMIRMPVFWIYYCWAVAIGAVGLTIVSQAGGIAMEASPQISSGSVATVVGLLSLFNGFGRIVFGSLFDKKGFRYTILLDLGVFFVGIVLLFIAVKTRTFLCVIAGFILTGLSYGGAIPMSSALINDFFGRKNYSKNFSVVSTTLMISSVASTISGGLFDRSGSYFSSLCMAAGLLIISVVLALFIRRPKSME